jgi:hypothetical protein
MSAFGGKADIFYTRFRSLLASSAIGVAIEFIGETLLRKAL